MQTRKRAKSVSFGKKKDKEEKEQVKKTVEEETAAPAVETTEKAEEPESKESHDEKEPELSATPPKTESDTPAEAVETPSNEFISDSPLSTSPELPTDSKAHEVASVSEPDKPDEENGELTQPAAPATPQATSPEAKGEQSESEELSSTLPPSAFTIQTQNNESPAEQQTPEADIEEEKPEKKHFGLYFIVVAFISFVLGLGAMAGASYLGLVNVNFSRLPAPNFLGQKPTPTVVPPTVAPTEKPVDLTTYSIAVLNGSGVSGKAADVKSSLTTAGFKVSSTGNADKSSYTKTEISAKKSVNHEFLVKLEDELNKSYNVDTTVASSPDSDSADVTVTLGQPNSQ